LPAAVSAHVDDRRFGAFRFLERIFEFQGGTVLFVAVRLRHKGRDANDWNFVRRIEIDGWTHHDRPGYFL
jgi:hypothetical protein